MLKKFLCFIIMLMSGIIYANAQSTTKIFVVSDPHVMAPELLVEDGMAFQKVETSTEKLFRYSYDFFSAIKDTILQRKPDLVLMPGDLTKSGELVSHQVLISMLDEIREQGIKVLVIPGNHDLNIISDYYIGDMTMPAEKTTPAQFVDMYQNYGYGMAIDRDSASLSYVCEPIEGLRMICIDSEGFYDPRLAPDNGEEQIHSFEKALTWILKKADEAREEGKQVFAMMHHNILEHFDGQAEYMKSYFLENGKNISQQFLLHGIRLVFTGHTHIQDIAKNYNAERTDSIIDIATGSLISYPCPFREVTVTDNFSQIDVKSGKLTKTKTSDDVYALSYERLYQNTLNRCPLYAQKFWSSFRRSLNQFLPLLQALEIDIFKFPQTSAEFGELTTRYMGEPISKACMIWYSGNENKNPLSAAIEQEVKDSMLRMSIDMLGDETVGKMAYDYAMQSYYTDNFEPIINSVINDCTNYGTDYADVTDDENATFTLPKPTLSGIRNITKTTKSNDYYTIDGRKVDVNHLSKGIYIHDGKKIVIR